MKQKYIKQDCPRCKNVHSMMLMANGICKCPSCGREYKVKNPLAEELKIDIGGGRNSVKGFKILDMIEEADYHCNLETERFPFDDESVSEFVSNHTFEHISNIINVFNEVWRTLKWGGRIKIKVPHKDCILAWQDPTHKRYWTEESFKFFCGKYIKKYKLDYGIRCCFKQLILQISAGKTSNPKGADYFTEITVILEKNKEYYDEIKYPLIEKKKINDIKPRGDRTEEFLEITKDFAKIFKNKNLDYGDGYFSGGYTGIERWMSIKRKVARLENYYKTNKLFTKDETIDETWKDLGIYCIMELMKRKADRE